MVPGGPWQYEGTAHRDHGRPDGCGRRAGKGQADLRYREGENVTRIVRAAACALVALFSSATLLGRADPPAAVPLVPGLTFVLAVHNTAPAGNTTVRSVAQGDYELVVAVTGVDSGGIDETTRIEGVDENKQPIQVTIRRRVLSSDLATARIQILGFHTDDPTQVPGSTSLGPSLAIVQDLKATGRAAYSVMNLVRLSTSSGTLTRVGT